ncbi:MAG TPA: anaerobic ribonucleoside-triphosphate reductase activating protein [Deltaproteobacteria bacterium]|nr:anaerobic ribonucleoside-triphosphate reductase activating protein [Deltaproteobacteria bacterium]
MNIGHLQRFSLIDYPGKISAIVFTQGCNFRCGYCHNPELVNPRLFSAPVVHDEVFAFLDKRRGKLDAVVITGGEPTMHKDLPEFAEAIKDMGYLVKLDTNGTNPELLGRMISSGTIDYIAMDIKAPIEKYEEVVNVRMNKEALMVSMNMIMDSDVDYEFRTTLVQHLFAPGDVIMIAEQIRGARQYVLQRFVPSKHVDADFIMAEAFSDEIIEDLRLKITPLVERLIVR